MTKVPDPDIRSNARAATGPTNRTAAIGDSRPPHAIARGRSRPGQHSAPGTDDPNEVRPNNPARLPAAPPARKCSKWERQRLQSVLPKPFRGIRNSPRSEERRVGKEWVGKCRIGWSTE